MFSKSGNLQQYEHNAWTFFFQVEIPFCHLKDENVARKTVQYCSIILISKA